MIRDYFKIIEEANSSLISLINKQTISDSEYFPIYGFGVVCPDIDNLDAIKQIQTKNLARFIREKAARKIHNHKTIVSIIADETIADSYKHTAIMYGVSSGQIPLEDVEQYLRNLPESQRKGSDYRRLLCLYDKKKYQS